MTNTKCVLTLLAILFYASSIGAAHSLKIIRKDTTWTAGNIYTGHYQIAPGATLTIEGGASVIRGLIEVAGTLAAGSKRGQRTVFKDTAIRFLPNSPQSAEINIENSAIIGGSLFAPTGHAVYGTFRISRSLISTSEYSYVWYPEAGSFFEGNLFYNYGHLSVGTRTPISIINNTFADLHAILVWANYGENLSINYNNFTGSSVALSTIYSGGETINAEYNWFETDLPGRISRRILDRRDDLTRSKIFDFKPFLTEAAADAPFSGTPDSDRFRGTNRNDLAFAGQGNDTLVGGRGHDVLLGGGGDDILHGGPGGDVLGGGEGNDRFVYKNVSESTPFEPDWILDFEPEGDKIVLSKVDANSMADGRQGFVFIGSQEFSGNPGELRFEVRKLNGLVIQTVILGNTNTDPEAEFMIILNGTIPLVANNFRL